MSYKKYYIYKQQVSYDNGETWEDVSPLVTTPSGDSIGEYATLEECEGVTSCTCSNFTYSPTNITVSSAATSLTISYTGCSQLSFSSAETYNWISIGSQSYDTATTVGNVTANISANDSYSRTATFNFSLNGVQCTSVYINQDSGVTPITCDCDSFMFEGTEETSS